VRGLPRYNPARQVWGLPLCCWEGHCWAELRSQKSRLGAWRYVGFLSSSETRQQVPNDGVTLAQCLLQLRNLASVRSLAGPQRREALCAENTAQRKLHAIFSTTFSLLFNRFSFNQGLVGACWARFVAKSEAPSCLRSMLESAAATVPSLKHLVRRLNDEGDPCFQISWNLRLNGHVSECRIGQHYAVTVLREHAK
jgi:hypothetical protein